MLLSVPSLECHLFPLPYKDLASVSSEGLATRDLLPESSLLPRASSHISSSVSTSHVTPRLGREGYREEASVNLGAHLPPCPPASPPDMGQGCWSHGILHPKCLPPAGPQRRCPRQPPHWGCRTLDTFRGRTLVLRVITTSPSIELLPGTGTGSGALGMFSLSV